MVYRTAAVDGRKSGRRRVRLKLTHEGRSPAAAVGRMTEGRSTVGGFCSVVVYASGV